MYEPTRNLLLRWLKVPPEPHAPFGDPASTRIFRAGKNYFNLRLLLWGIGQAFALAGIIFWLVVFINVEQAIKARRQAGAVAVAPTSVKDFGEYLEKIGADEKPPAPAPGPAAASTAPAGAPAAVTPAPGSNAEPAAPALEPAKEPRKTPDAAKKRRPRPRINGWAGFKQLFVSLGMLLPPWSFPVIWVLKIAGFIFYLVQIPLTYSVRRLDYEMRWYVVTDRSLRIRTGVWSVQELTMSFANLQQVVVTQGPVQRLLGLADVLVQSAGGGTIESRHGGHESGLHAGHFHGVEHAEEIRDLILERLRRFRESGLGDLDEARAAHPPATAAGDAPSRAALPPGPELLAAARELRDEARALRAALG